MLVAAILDHHYLSAQKKFNASIVFLTCENLGTDTTIMPLH